MPITIWIIILADVPMGKRMFECGVDAMRRLN